MLNTFDFFFSICGSFNLTDGDGLAYRLLEGTARYVFRPRLRCSVNKYISDEAFNAGDTDARHCATH